MEDYEKKYKKAFSELCEPEEMAQWKNKQFKSEEQALIEKACEWLKDNARNYYSAYATEDRLIEDFKKAMKGGEE